MEVFPQARRRRKLRFVGVLGSLGVLGATLFAFSGSSVAGEAGSSGVNHRWHGTWAYEHQFGEGRMQLCEEFVRSGGTGHWVLAGYYYSLEGEGGGRITGTLTNRRTLWSAHFKNRGDTVWSPANATWLGGEFDGTWRSCYRNSFGFRRCRGPYDWSGRKIDGDPNGAGC